MNRKSVMLGLSAIGALVLAGNAQAQTVGVAGQVVAPAPAVPTVAVTPSLRAPATPAVPATPAIPSAAATGADASATANGQTTFPVGTVVRDSAGAQLGTVMAPDPTMSVAGRVYIKTSSGFITVPADSLTLKDGVAVSAQTSADIAKPKPE